MPGIAVGEVGGAACNEVEIGMETTKLTLMETSRLILRPWEMSDAPWLYEYASHPYVGPAAGWPVHTDVAHSESVIRDVFSAPETYAVVLKSEKHAVGCIGLMSGKASNLGLPDNEGEIGYWIGVPYWGQGLIPEAVRELLRRGFEDLHLDKIWCAYLDGNFKSQRVAEKCGFTYHHTNRDIYCALTDDIRTEHVTCMSRESYYRIYCHSEDRQSDATRQTSQV